MPNNIINWKQKLTSRKFWAAVIGVVAAVLVLCNVDNLTAERIVALVSAEGTLIAYIFAEGSVDKAAITSELLSTKEDE